MVAASGVAAVSPRQWLGGLSTGLGLVLLVWPTFLAERFKHAVDASDSLTASLDLSFGAAVGLTTFGLIHMIPLRAVSRKVLWWLLVAASCVTYLALVRVLANWMIDDAAITFAYSENLVRYHKITLHPNLPVEEGYSNTLWMLWLAAARALGLGIPAVAKVSCTVLGLVTIGLVHWAVWRQAETERDASADELPARATDALLVLIPTLILFAAPYLVWSVSGLEHTLQALCILIAATAPLFTARWWIPTAVALSAFVLVRPEAPLVVASCFAVHVAYAKRTRSWWDAAVASLGVAVIPAVAWFLLIGFRLSYFGDALPNPFYVKASDATFLRLINLVGGGWEYVMLWVYGSGILVTLPFLARALLGVVPLPVALGLGMLVAHLAFVIYAMGDWMGCWRFMSPVLPTLAFVVAWAYRGQAAISAREGHASTFATRVVTWVTLCALCWGGTKQYIAFAGNPTTPYLVVAHVGERFVELGERLGLRDPILAHHDAGGTSYKARIQLLDLGGLGNRPIAKHWHDPEFIAHYVLEDVAPDFVFGVANNFAAGTIRLAKRPEFLARYVPVRFAGDPLMRSDLCHIKRSLVESPQLPPGITVERKDGVVSNVLVK
jgi:hypothetical protein